MIINPLKEIQEKWKQKREILKFDIQTLEEYRSSSVEIGLNISEEDLAGLFFMKGQVNILDDVLRMLSMIDGMVGLNE